MLHSLLDFSHSLRHPQSNWALLVLIPEWVGLCTLKAPVGLSNKLSCEAGSFSCSAASTPMGILNQRFEALFPCAGGLGCAVCFVPPLFILVYLRVNVGSRGQLAAAWPALFHNPWSHWVHQPPPCLESSPPWLPVSALAAPLHPSYWSG